MGLIIQLGMVITASAVEHCRFRDLPPMALTRYDACYDQPEDSYTHGSVCSYNCAHYFISDSLARDNDLASGLPYMVPDDDLEAFLVNMTIPVPGTDIQLEPYSAVGTIQCMCSTEYDSYGSGWSSGDGSADGSGWSSGDGSGEPEPYVPETNFCQWIFTLDSFNNPTQHSKCGENFLRDVELALSYHAENNTLKNSIRNETELELLDMISPYHDLINLYDNTTLPDFFDTIHAYGFTSYVGYGVLNVDCLNGELICLIPDLFYPHDATDTLQRAQCDQIVADLTVLVNETRIAHEDTLTTTIDTNVAALELAFNTTFDANSAAFYDVDFPAILISTVEDIGMQDATNGAAISAFMEDSFAYIVDSVTALQTDLETNFNTDDDAKKAAAMQAVDDEVTDMTNAKIAYFSVMDNAEQSRIDQMSALIIKNATEYADLQFHVPGIKTERRLYNMEQLLHEMTEPGYTFKVNDADTMLVVDQPVSQETVLSLEVPDRLFKLKNKVARRLEESGDYYLRHTKDALSGIKTLLWDRIEDVEKKLLADKDRDRENVIDQSAAYAVSTSTGLFANANGAILEIMRESRAKTSTIEGNLKGEMQALQDQATTSLLNANVDYARQVGAKKVELAQYLSDQIAIVHASMSELRDALKTKMDDQNNILLEKIAVSKAITSNQLRIVVDTIATHFEGNTNMTGINFDPNQYYIF